MRSSPKPQRRRSKRGSQDIRVVPLVLALAAVVIVSLVAIEGARSGSDRRIKDSPFTFDQESFSGSAPVLGVVVDASLRVVAVEPGSTAQDAGIRPGDVITGVAATAVTTSASAKQVYRQTAKPGQPVVIVLRRAGQTVTLSRMIPHSVIRQAGVGTATPVPPTLDYF